MIKEIGRTLVELLVVLAVVVMLGLMLFSGTSTPEGVRRGYDGCGHRWAG